MGMYSRRWGIWFVSCYWWAQSLTCCGPFLSPIWMSFPSVSDVKVPADPGDLVARARKGRSTVIGHDNYQLNDRTEKYATDSRGCL
jgi:hypothetical protein